MMLSRFFDRRRDGRAEPENPARALAMIGVEKRASADRSDRARFRAMAREIAALRGFPIPTILEN